jgi:site-specific DNA-methyltransferase (adenine-specific)
VKKTKLSLGDCREVLKKIPENFFHSVVTDPPYELGFMNKGWDKGGIAYDPTVWSEVLRVLKPGGYLLAFGGTRTYHRLAVAIEDAGFEVRDSIHWIYGSGFPKSLDVSKAIDDAAGVEREVVGFPDKCSFHKRGEKCQGHDDEGQSMSGPTIHAPTTVPTTEAAKKWEGWGTALKPAHEPIVLARKPFERTVAANIQEYGTGGLNVVETKIPGSVPNFERYGVSGFGNVGETYNKSKRDGLENTGRWPSNVVLSPEAAKEVDLQTGGLDEEIGASRFFPIFKYEPKASREERDLGLRSLPFKTPGELMERKDGAAGTDHARAGGGHGGGRNTHPTVKPIDLMRWLVRLVTPKGGIVLDPFMGSGSTGAAAVLEAMNFAGIELDPESFKIAELRIEYWKKIEVQEDLF